MSSDPALEPDAVPGRDDAGTVTTVRVRRAPRLWVFLLLGSIAGALVTLAVTGLGHVDAKVGFAATFGYFCLFGVPAGFALGALVGLLLDRRSSRRVRTATAELERVDPPHA